MPTPGRGRLGPDDLPIVGRRYRVDILDARARASFEAVLVELIAPQTRGDDHTMIFDNGVRVFEFHGDLVEL